MKQTDAAVHNLEANCKAEISAVRAELAEAKMEIQNLKDKIPEVGASSSGGGGHPVPSTPP
eukprot:3086814-Karenia_brevis.AAC.1